MTQDKNRCVITGLGVVSAIGRSLPECWQSILASKSGIGRTATVSTENCYTDYSAEIADFPENGEDRTVALCLSAVREALSDAAVEDFNGDRRASVIMGSCVGGGKSIEKYYTEEKSRENVLNMPISALANHAAALCHAGGTVTNIANACAAGTISIAYACDLIRAGRSDIVVAGGADAFSPVPYAGFLSLHALEDGPCSPFNRSHGITLGEGAGALIVESYEHAKARGAKIYCEVLGAGVSSDAFHITAPRPDGAGQIAAIRAAIADSGLSAADIDYINAHGTGTAKNDEAEFLSLHTIFDPVHGTPGVSSTKAMTGHCLGAAGAIEAVFTVKALTENCMPPTLGYRQEDMELLVQRAGEMDFCPNVPVSKELTNVMSNSFAFGGNNASIVFGKQRGDVPSVSGKKEIVLSGMGLVTPLGSGKTRYIEACKADERICTGSAASHVGAEELGSVGLKMAFYRKLDHFSQLQAVSGLAALHDSGLTVDEGNAERIGIAVGTSEGALGPSCDFQKMIAEKGNAAGSAFKFPNTVYNAAGGYLSICAGIRGYSVTVTNGAQSGLQSAVYAVNVLQSGRADAMLVSGSDENSEILSELYGTLGLVADEAVKPYSEGSGFPLSDGSVTLVLESRENAAARSAEVYCRVCGCGMAHDSVPFGTLTGSAEALRAAIDEALRDGGLRPDEIDAVIGFANGCKAVDTIETETLPEMFGNVPVISVKERVGEGRAAAAALGLAHAALLLHGDLSAEADAYRCVDGKLCKCAVEADGLGRILVISYGSGGSYTAVILAR